MVLFPNAKINLGLDIISRRPDGYHDIATVMLPTGWTDVLEIVPGKGDTTTLTVSGRSVDCPAEKNLVMKAYRALEKEVSLPPVDIFLRKIIPDGAGLGGGSADAAFTLIGLNKLFSLDLEDSRLAEIAAQLGADCPFFICNRPMLCTGIGTDLSPIKMPGQLLGKWLLIVKPEVSVPTAAAYRGVTPAIPTQSITEIINRPISDWKGLLKNDFEPTVFAAFPTIRAVKEKIDRLGALYASMSGSGAAVYGIFETEVIESADLAALFPGCTTHLGKL